MANQTDASDLTVSLNNWLIGPIGAAISAAKRSGSPVPEALVNRLQDAFKAALDSLYGITQSQADKATMLADPTRTDAYKVPKARDMVNAACQKAQSAVDALNTVSNDVNDRLSVAWKTGKRATVDSVLLDTKIRQLERYLDSVTSGPSGVVQAAAALYAKAINRPASDTDAYYTSHALAHCFDLYFLERGCLAADVNSQFAIAAGAQNSPDGSAAPGGELAALLQGGPGTVQGWVVAAKSVIYRAQQDNEDWYAKVTGLGPLELAQQQQVAALKAQQQQAQDSLDTLHRRLGVQ